MTRATARVQGLVRNIWKSENQFSIEPMLDRGFLDKDVFGPCRCPTWLFGESQTDK